MKQGTVSVRQPVVVGGSVFIDCVCRAVRGGINQLEQRSGEANIIKTWSHVSSKVSSPFGNALRGQANVSALLGSFRFNCFFVH